MNFPNLFFSNPLEDRQTKFGSFKKQSQAISTVFAPFPDPSALSTTDVIIFYPFAELDNSMTIPWWN